jgi:hypothetical protein
MTENILRGIQTDFYRKSEIGLSDIDQAVEFRPGFAGNNFFVEILPSG